MKRKEYFSIVMVIICFFILVIFNGLLPCLSNAINASFSGILVLVTFFYLLATYGILEEQKTSRKIEPIDKLIEKVYSPIDNALMEFHQELCNFDSLPDTLFTNPFQLINGFTKLNTKYMEINRNYGHLFDNDIRVAFDKLWDSWQRFITPPHSHVKELSLAFRGLQSDIIDFRKLLDTKIKEEIKKRNDLIQQ